MCPSPWYAPRITVRGQNIRARHPANFSGTSKSFHHIDLWRSIPAALSASSRTAVLVTTAICGLTLLPINTTIWLWIR